MPITSDATLRKTNPSSSAAFRPPRCNDSHDKRKAEYTALLSGGTSGFDAVLGGNRSVDGQYERLEAHGVYWEVVSKP